MGVDVRGTRETKNSNNVNNNNNIIVIMIGAFIKSSYITTYRQLI